jgi:hypothetical protein
MFSKSCNELDSLAVIDFDYRYTGTVFQYLNFFYYSIHIVQKNSSPLIVYAIEARIKPELHGSATLVTTCVQDFIPIMFIKKKAIAIRLKIFNLRFVLKRSSHNILCTLCVAVRVYSAQYALFFHILEPFTRIHRGKPQMGNGEGW